MLVRNGLRLVVAAALLGGIAGAPTRGFAQDSPAPLAEESTGAEAAAAEEAPTPDGPAAETSPDSAETGAPEAPGPSDPTTDPPSADTPAGDGTEGDGAAGGGAAGDGDPAAGDAPAADGAPAAGAPVDGEAAAAAVPVSSFDWGTAAIILAAVVAPWFLGDWIAKALRVPEYGWKLSVILFALAAPALCIAYGELKGGPDLNGGITLIYDVADKDRVSTAAPDDPDAPAAEGAVPVQRLIDALKQRVDPAGTMEVSIRQYGDAIEIIIPKTSQEALEYVKRKITNLGELEFRITADPRWKADESIVAAAQRLRPSEKTLSVGGQPRARWVPYDAREFGPDDSRIVQRQAGKTPEALVLIDRLNVTGQYLSNVGKGIDPAGRPMVQFGFNAQGAARFGRLTEENSPNQATGMFRNLGILLDGRLISAPKINERIGASGQISGGSMTEEEVDFIVSILNAGSLPAALNKVPLSETTISPTLGKETIERGKVATLISMVLVLLMVSAFYRLAGVLAAAALLVNLLLVVGFMVLFKATFTLPGLAGLVLGVGMAVDANILIYERMREELARGAALRMAIRNGFERATTTITDSNLTTMCTAVVLWFVGTDNLKSFAVTLFLGIVVSMFTAIFCSRAILEIAERRRWITTLKFMPFISRTNFDFLGWRHLAYAVSGALMVLSVVAIYFRGPSFLDIDFSGGTSVTMALEEPTPIQDVRTTLEKTVMGQKNFTVVSSGDQETRYTVSSAVETVEEAQQILKDSFGDKLLNYSLEVGEPSPFQDGDEQGVLVPLTFNAGEGFSDEDGLSHDALLDQLKGLFAATGDSGVVPSIENPDYVEGSSQRFKEWDLRVTGVAQDKVLGVLGTLRDQLSQTPAFPMANKIGGRVAGDLTTTAIRAVVLSLLLVSAYLWFRFQSLAYGLAAGLAVAHDVVVTAGVMAASAFVVKAVPPLASALQLESFQLGLTVIAALLTIIGYSLNDTIVVFDRIREVRGKSPRLTAQMINDSVNQTLSRTLLTSATTLVVLVVLYFYGGPGLHGFSFALLVGIIFGTYSSIYIASPLLLLLTGGSPTESVARPRASAGAA